MSMQLVNLYVPELKPKKEWLTADSIALVAIGFAILLVLAIVFMQRHLEEYEREIVLLEQQRSGIEARLNRIKTMPRSINSRQIDRKLTMLKNSIAQREQIGSIIEGQNLGNELGFSQYMLGVSRQSLETLSLNRIRLSRGGSFVELKGLTSNAEDVPRFIENLQTEESFRDSQFGLMSVAETSRLLSHEFAFGFGSVFLASEGEK